MEGIEFDEPGSDLKPFSVMKKTHPQEREKKSSFTLKVLEKIGVTDKTTADLILLAVAVVFFGITIFLYAGILNQ